MNTYLLTTRSRVISFLSFPGCDLSMARLSFRKACKDWVNSYEDEVDRQTAQSIVDEYYIYSFHLDDVEDSVIMKYEGGLFDNGDSEKPNG